MKWKTFPVLFHMERVINHIIVPLTCKCMNVCILIDYFEIHDLALKFLKVYKLYKAMQSYVKL